MREDWVESKIDQIITDDGLFKDGDWVESKDQDPNGDVRLIQLADIGDGSFRNKSSRFLTSKKSKELNCTFLNQGDIIIARMPDPLGRATIFPLTGKNVTVVDVAIIRTGTNNIETKYLLYCLNSPSIRQEIEALQSGSTRKRISRKNLAKIFLPIAPLPEQRAIVEKIEKLFSDLDNGIANLKTAQAQLKVYRQAVLKKAFEGELTKEWRAKQTDLPSAEELLENIKTERENHYHQQLSDWEEEVKAWEEHGKEGKKPRKPSAIKKLSDLSKDEIDELSELDSSWKWIKVDWIAFYERNSIKAGPFGSSLKKIFYVEKGYKVYGQEQVISGEHNLGDYYISKDRFKKLESCKVQPNDILISLVGTVGKVLILPENCEKGIINPRLVKITTNKFYSTLFFKYYFESAFLKSLYKHKNHGTTMDVLNLGIIKDLPFPICSVQEQHQIVQEIESRLSVCDQVEKDLAESLEKAEALRQSILKKAFEGKLLTKKELKACRNEPDWEPASVLLDKIKAEKKIKN